MAFRYHASVRVRMKNIGRITNKDKEVIGRTVQAQVIKSRVGPSFRTAVFDVLFDSGIQDLSSWLDYLKDHGLITGTRAGYGFKCTTNKEIMTADKFVEVANSNPAFREEVYNAICDSYITTYRDPNSKIVEDVEHVEGDEEEKDKKTEKEKDREAKVDEVVAEIVQEKE